MQARQAGKSALLGAMYGSKLHQDMINKVMGMREHPLEYMSSYQFISRQPDFGNAAVYKVSTKILSQIICKKEKVPHTKTHYCMVSEIDGVLQSGEIVAACAWIRRSDLEDLKQAVATLIMMGKEPVLLRAFEP